MYALPFFQHSEKGLSTCHRRRKVLLVAPNSCSTIHSSSLPPPNHIPDPFHTSLQHRQHTPDQAHSPQSPCHRSGPRRRRSRARRTSCRVGVTCLRATVRLRRTRRGRCSLCTRAAGRDGGDQVDRAIVYHDHAGLRKLSDDAAQVLARYAGRNGRRRQAGDVDDPGRREQTARVESRPAAHGALRGRAARAGARGCDLVRDVGAAGCCDGRRVDDGERAAGRRDLTGLAEGV
jgi:hypothetical protein